MFKAHEFFQPVVQSNYYDKQNIETDFILTEFDMFTQGMIYSNKE